MWQKGPYGLSILYIWNSMSCDAYDFLRRNMHFADNSLQQPEGSEGYDPLFKVRYPLDVIGKVLQKIWTTGQHITIDESMIKQWDGAGEKRPNFMRQDPFVPCNCGKCFFCLNGITTGIAHPPSKKVKVTVEFNCGTRLKTNKCTADRVSLGMKSGGYCRMCYRKQACTDLKANDRIQRCRTSAMGCAVCKEPICKECWKEGYNKHK